MPTRPMRILLTNNSLRYRAGTELYVRDVAIALKQLGHDPVCFSRKLGPIVDELAAGDVLSTDDLSSLPPPDLIHGHHLVETTLAAARFPSVPVVSFCHGPRAWQEFPCLAPNVVRHIAVDEACRRRLIERHGIRSDGVGLLLNWVDTRRFPARSTPLPAQPKSAALFSNYATERAPYVAAIRDACAAAGINLEIIGAGVGRPIDQPADVLSRFDIVFAKARCAIEAMAVGCAVIQCEHFGAGRLVTTENFDALRALNFGFESMTIPVTSDHILAEVRRYDPRDAAAVARRIRDEASLERFMPRLIAVYDDVLATTGQRSFSIRPFDHLAPIAHLLEGGAAADAIGWEPDDLKAVDARLAKAERDLTRWREQRTKDRMRIERLKERVDELGRRRPSPVRRFMNALGRALRGRRPNRPDE